jgi:hypothetical protein
MAVIGGGMAVAFVRQSYNYNGDAFPKEVEADARGTQILLDVKL